MSVPFASSDVQISDDDRGYQVRRPPSSQNPSESVFPDLSQSDSTDVSSYSQSVAQARPSFSPCPCAILQAFACCHGYGSGAQSPPAIIGDAELSQLVFMHRAAFLACSASFKGLASVLEKRVQLVDGVVGMDAEGMLRTEAWLLSGWGA